MANTVGCGCGGQIAEGGVCVQLPVVRRPRKLCADVGERALCLHVLLCAQSPIHCRKRESCRRGAAIKRRRARRPPQPRQMETRRMKERRAMCLVYRREIDRERERERERRRNEQRPGEKRRVCVAGLGPSRLCCRDDANPGPAAAPMQKEKETLEVVPVRGRPKEAGEAAGRLGHTRPRRAGPPASADTEACACACARTPGRPAQDKSQTNGRTAPPRAATLPCTGRVAPTTVAALCPSLHVSVQAAGWGESFSPGRLIDQRGTAAKGVQGRRCRQHSKNCTVNVLD